MLSKKMGFTLIELMIVVAIIGILAAIALPSYQEYVRKSRRTDATVMISQIQQAQEKYRANNIAYASTLSDVFTYTAADHPYYQAPVISLATGLADYSTGYTITVTAKGSQVNDKANGTTCTMVMTVKNGNTTATPTDCWAK